MSNDKHNDNRNYNRNNNFKNSSTYTRKPKSAAYESHNRLVTTKMGQVEKIIHKDPCRILDTCGSCSLLSLNYKSQLAQKVLKLKERFKEAGSFFTNITIQHFVESEERLAYRQSVKLVVSEHSVQGKSWIDIGFYRQTLNKVVDIGNCPIQNNVLNDILYYLKSAFKTLQIPIYSPRKRSGILSGIILRSSRATKQTFVTLLVRELSPVIFRELACGLVEKLSCVEGVFLQLDSPEINKVTEPVLLAGTCIIEEKFGSKNFKIRNDVELPIHPIMTSKLYARIEELCDLSGTQILLQLFSGLGALSCLLSQKAHMVYTLDEKLECAKNTELNLKFHNIKNVQIEVGKIHKILPQLAISGALSKCDSAIITSPRGGLGEDLIQKLCTYAPKQIIYTSLFNEFMIEDLKYFAKKNYKPLFVEPFDSHPGTPYFEVLCYLKQV